MKRWQLTERLFLPFLFFFVSHAMSNVKLPAVISDNMVLQQGQKVPVWGKADPGESVTVVIGNQSKTAITNKAGKWMVKLDSLHTGGPYDMIVSGNNTLTVKNILVGEVWVCSGQSNMEWPVKQAVNGEQEVVEARYPEIRLITNAWTVSGKPLDDIVIGMVDESLQWDFRSKGPVEWVECTPQTAATFAATGYFFGRELHRKLNVPVGLIKLTFNGTAITGWTRLKTLQSYKEFQPLLNEWGQAFLEYPSVREKYDIETNEWRIAAENAKAEGKQVPHRPWLPRGPDHPHCPGVLFNGMISPFIPFGIKGVIWYQGEADGQRGYLYRKLFPAMIRDWREAWDQGDFPFLFAQLANFNSNLHLYKREVSSEPMDDYWPEVREAQAMALSLPKTGMAVTIDIGESDDIHPKNKQDVGYRLALAAQAIAYGCDIVYSGPIFDSMLIDENKAIIRFKHVGSGLISKVGEKLKGFEIAGKDRKFVWAEARINGNELIIWSDTVKNPLAVRYAWRSDPQCNLYNKEGLPASPFRTDDWPGISVNK